MSTFAPDRYIFHDSPVANAHTDLGKTAVGRRDTTLERARYQPPTAEMNDMNPQAMPFQPGGGNNNDPRLWNRSRNENLPPSMPPHGFQGAPWNPNFHPPPPPPPFYLGSQHGYNHYEAREQAQAFEQARLHYQQWTQQYGHGGPQAPFPPYGQPPMLPQQQYPPPFQHQQRPQPRQPAYLHPAHYSNLQQANWPTGATKLQIQYAFSALVEGIKSRKRGADTDDRAPTQPSKKSKKSKAKVKAAADVFEDHLEYGSLHPVDPFDRSSSRIDRGYSSTSPHGTAGKKGKYGDEKIMLPAPQPTDLYLSQAAEEPTVIDPAGHVLVILDLNGTVLYRPNRNAKTMIARPYLRPFLQYLFQNFKVMVWSSARPDNVKALVDQALDKDLRSMLVATWARDTFGLSAKYYSQNVQVYKNLRLVWSRDQIQQHHPEYEAGKRFGQHNTVLIDDSALKASAQPHNLLEIPEFEATPEQMEGDMLREVAGYLEIVRHQGDVSKFVHKQPFKGDGRWSYDWPADSAGGGEMESKVTLKGTGKSPLPAAPGKKVKGRTPPRLAKVATEVNSEVSSSDQAPSSDKTLSSDKAPCSEKAPSSDQVSFSDMKSEVSSGDKVSSSDKVSPPGAPLSAVTDSLSAVTLCVEEDKEWANRPWDGVL
jgi:hypothetical protein